METTGYYHYQLAYFLQEKKVKVSVENPLSVKRFIQMKLSKIKTDKSDSKLICEYTTGNFKALERPYKTAARVFANYTIIKHI